MKLTSLLRPVLVYTGLFGLLTVGAVYLTTHSGLFVLLLAAAGLLLVVLGGGTAARVSGSGTEPVEADGVGMEATRLLPNSDGDSSLRLVLLFYGTGVFLWSLVVLLTLRDTLV
jgi:hypothetical protein